MSVSPNLPIHPTLPLSPLMIIKNLWILRGDLRGHSRRVSDGREGKLGQRGDPSRSSANQALSGLPTWGSSLSPTPVLHQHQT